MNFLSILHNFFLNQLPWPRTQSEKLLAEMFEGSAAQMLCLLETLSDTNRRTLISAPPAADSEVEILDVYAELFMAAQEIIAGERGIPDLFEYSWVSARKT